MSDVAKSSDVTKTFQLTDTSTKHFLCTTLGVLQM